MAKYVDGSEGSTGIYTTRVPDYTDAADIQEALKLYHYGSSTVPTTNTIGGLNGINANSIAGHLKKLSNDIDALPTTAEVEDLIDGATGDFADKAGIGIDGNSVETQFDISPRLTLISPKEKTTISATAPTGVVNIDVMTSSIHDYTTAATANWTTNIRGNAATTLNSIMEIGEQISVVVESIQSTLGYFSGTFTIDGSAVEVKWLDGVMPSQAYYPAVIGSPPPTNYLYTGVYVYTIKKIGAATFKVLASHNKFSIGPYITNG